MTDCVLTIKHVGFYNSGTVYLPFIKGQQYHVKSLSAAGLIKGLG